MTPGEDLSRARERNVLATVPLPGVPAPRPRRRGFGHAEVYALIGALSFAVARWAPVLALPFLCPFQALTGLPCASCGMTHAFVDLARGEVARAVAASPLGALLAALAWAFAVADALLLAAGLPVTLPGPRAARALALLGCAALLANWAFLMVAHRA